VLAVEPDEEIVPVQVVGYDEKFEDSNVDCKNVEELRLEPKHLMALMHELLVVAVHDYCLEP